MTRSRVIAFGLLLGLASACTFQARPPNGQQGCAAVGGKRCPDGYYCATGDTCWKNGEGPSPMAEGGVTTPDSGTGGPSDAVPTRKSLGIACSANAECGSGLSVDHVCCDSACDKGCQACDLPGKVGTCGTRKGAPPPAEKCPAQHQLCAATCDGTSEDCNYPNATTECAVPSCTSGNATLRAGCDGKGACQVAQTQMCAPYSCADDKACATDCSAAVPCQQGNYCVASRCFKEPPVCQKPEDCAAGFNCSGGYCTVAAMSCSAIRAADMAATDGIYWINPGILQRAYCDMKEGLDLCTEMRGEHTGVTRDSTRLVFKMTSKLDVAAGVCQISALRGAADSIPLSPVQSPTDPQPETCPRLGFVADGTFNMCLFGRAYKMCEFPISQYTIWGTLWNPDLAYGLMSPIDMAYVLTTYDGSTTSSCKVR